MGEERRSGEGRSSHRWWRWWWWWGNGAKRNDEGGRIDVILRRYTWSSVPGSDVPLTRHTQQPASVQDPEEWVYSTAPHRSRLLLTRGYNAASLPRREIRDGAETALLPPSQRKQDGQRPRVQKTTRGGIRKGYRVRRFILLWQPDFFFNSQNPLITDRNDFVSRYDGEEDLSKKVFFFFFQDILLLYTLLHAFYYTAFYSYHYCSPSTRTTMGASQATRPRDYSKRNYFVTS